MTSVLPATLSRRSSAVCTVPSRPLCTRTTYQRFAMVEVVRGLEDEEDDLADRQVADQRDAGREDRADADVRVEADRPVDDQRRAERVAGRTGRAALPLLDELESHVVLVAASAAPVASRRSPRGARLGA